MAGVKGKSGGARKGAGGARPGAGRKPKLPKAESANEQASAVEVTLEPQPHGGALKRSESVPVPTSESDMLQLLKDIAMGKIEASPIQVRAAIAAVQYTHAKVGEGGKKEQAKEKAAEVAQGRFGSRKPPLSVVR